MTRPSLEIVRRDLGDVTILELKGELILHDGDAVFRDAINALIAEGRLKIVVNLREVSYIDSAGIGVLIGRFLGVRRRGGEMKLAHLTHRSHRVMTITRLLTVFDTYDSVEDALKALAPSAPS